MSGDIFAVQKRYPQFRAGEIRFASDIRAFARVKDSYFSAVRDSTRGVPPRSEWRGKSRAAHYILNNNAQFPFLTVIQSTKGHCPEK